MSSLQPYWHESKSSTFFLLYFYVGNCNFPFCLFAKEKLPSKISFQYFSGGSKNKIQAHCSGRVFKEGVLKFSALEVCLKDVCHLIFLLRIFLLVFIYKSTIIIIISNLSPTQTSLHKIFWVHPFYLSDNKHLVV